MECYLDIDLPFVDDRSLSKGYFNNGKFLKAVHLLSSSFSLISPRFYINTAST